MRIDVRWVDLLSRMLMSALFLLSGLQKLGGGQAIQGYMTHFGVPAFLIWPAALFEIGTGAALIAGLRVREVASVMAGWCLLTAAIFHSAFADQMQMVLLLKNLAMAGGFLALARNDAARRTAIQTAIGSPT